jgi:cytochrome c
MRTLEFHKAITLASCAALFGLTAASSASGGDASHGKTVFATQCGICHSARAGGSSMNGPALYGVIGRPAGSLPGYNYSKAMKSAGFSWDDRRLEAYLPAPRVMISGTKMTYNGLKNPTQRADLIAYLDTLK